MLLNLPWELFQLLLFRQVPARTGYGLVLLMPVSSFLGIGVVPLLQWVLVPLARLRLVNRRLSSTSVRAHNQ